MCKLSLHHLLFVVYLWQSVAFLECSAGNADQDQDFRSPQKVTTHCLENCSLATSTTPNINVKVSVVSSFQTGIENVTPSLMFALKTLNSNQMAEDVRAYIITTLSRGIITQHFVARSGDEPRQV